MIKKICFFTTNFSTHAQNRAQYARNYLPPEVDIYFITPPSQNKYKFKGIKIIKLKENKLNFILELRKFCKDNNIDLLIHFGTTRECWGMFFSTIGTKTKYIIQIVGNSLDAPKIEKNFFKKFFLYLENFSYIVPFSFSKRIIFGAKDIQERTKRIYFFIKDKMEYADLILDEKLFSPKNKTNMRKKLNLPLNKKIIIFVARIEYLKGSDIMLSLIKDNPDKLFILVGKINDSSFLNLNLSNLLILNPLPPEELAEYYNASDLSILPSRIEGYGLVSRESMLCKTPSLVSDIPSLRMIKYALKAGLSKEKMQQKINEFFLMSEKKKKYLQEISRESIIKETSYKNLKDKYKNLILG
jgi:glycosyltransferase involved in cell wall biosynthesis